jgi:YD repeat-containing protein
MKKVILGLVLAALLACEYKDIAPGICYLASEQTQNATLSYSYDDHNQMISYTSNHVSSSVLTYDNSGKIISELDNGTIQITYDYDQKNQLVQWTEMIANYPSYNYQIAFTYNGAGQDTLKQYYGYDVSLGSYYLLQYQRLSYKSADTKNFSEKKTYNPSSTLLYTENFLWDNHPNPHLTNPFFTNEPPPSNNVVQYTYTPVGAIPSTIAFTYTYNNNGFPLSQTTTSGSSTIAVYTYANCH